MYHAKKPKQQQNNELRKKVLKMLDGTRSHENRFEIGVVLMQRQSDGEWSTRKKEKIHTLDSMTHFDHVIQTQQQTSEQKAERK